MSHQFWGVYAVTDHKVHRAFVADVLLYERLVVPVPPAGTRWPAAWDAERQAKLLARLGTIVHRVPWTPERRQEFQARWTAATAADDVSYAAAHAEHSERGGVSPEAAMVTRQLITDELTTK